MTLSLERGLLCGAIGALKSSGNRSRIVGLRGRRIGLAEELHAQHAARIVSGGLLPCDFLRALRFVFLREIIRHGLASLLARVWKSPHASEREHFEREADELGALAGCSTARR